MRWLIGFIFIMTMSVIMFNVHSSSASPGLEGRFLSYHEMVHTTGSCPCDGVLYESSDTTCDESKTTPCSVPCVESETESCGTFNNYSGNVVGYCVLDDEPTGWCSVGTDSINCYRPYECVLGTREPCSACAQVTCDGVTVTECTPVGEEFECWPCIEGTVPSGPWVEAPSDECVCFE